MKSVVCFSDCNTEKTHLFLAAGDWREFRDVEIDMNDKLSCLMEELYDHLFVNYRQDFNLDKFPEISQMEATEYIREGAHLVFCGRNKRMLGQ